MDAQVKTCQNCKNSFTIEPEDIVFYDKIKVPSPTFCRECRFARRFSFRNTHCLYKRPDSFSGKEILSIYSHDKNLVVIDQKEWWGDGWDSLEYGSVYDFSESFFAQWKHLRDRIPLQSLSNSKAVNSEYCNVAEENYDCYLCTACYRNERVLYSDSISFMKDSMDLLVVHRGEFSYENINCSDSYKLFYSQDSHSCTDCYFLYDCKGCTNSFMSSNLRNKSYYFFNEQVSKERYTEEMSKLNLGSRSAVLELKNAYAKMKQNSLHRYAHIVNSYNVTGNNVDHAKNAHFTFDTTEGPEDSKFIFWGGMGVKDSYDTDASGGGLELAYETFDAGVGGSASLFFCSVVYSSSRMEYCFNCYNCTDCFGCIGLRNKKYCILNTQYTKEEYQELRTKIIDHMFSVPYSDQEGHTYSYGEFFPSELSPFAYNETVASDYLPLSREVIESKGLLWKESEEKHYTQTMTASMIPDTIESVDDSIVNEIIECRHRGECEDRCTTAFRITKDELTFYKRLSIPIPDLCYRCRHYERFRARNPLKLWHRSCMCTYTNHDHNGICPHEFETSYCPDRPEKIYCEKCYQQEVL
jgi:hypothetical protein